MAKYRAIFSTFEETTYRQPNLVDCTLDDNGLEYTCPLDNGKYAVVPQCSLGALDNLPLEALCNILVEVDIRSLSDFRRVNKRAMQVVDSVLEYQQVLKNCPTLLRGFLSTGLGSNFSCKTLIETLNDYRCAACGDFAGFVYMITCERVCFLCLSEKPEYFPLLLSEAARKFGVHRKVLALLPTLESIPGRYSPNENTCKTRSTLIDPTSAYHKGVEYHGSAQAMEQHVAEVAQKRLEAYQQSAAANPGNSASRRPPTIGLRQGRTLDPRRFMAIVRVPWIVRPTSTVDWGFHCVGCQKHYRSRPLHWRRKYCLETFEHHIEQCGPIKDGVHIS